MVVGALAMLLLLLSARSQSQSESHSQTYDFDIPRTSRVMALHELSRQADGLLLGYLSNDTAEEQQLVGPIKGRHSVEEALRAIVQSSMLTFRWAEQNMVSVEPLQVAREAPERDEDLRRTLPRSGGVDPGLPPKREEIVVTSSLVGALVDAIRPAVVQDKDRIDAIGVPTLADALKYISQSAYSRPEGYRASGAQYAEMRGLGADVALILINGRRTLPSANSLSSSAFDLNTLPITAVDRIEFLLDSAAAPYGTDAIGGVINIVLVQKVPEPVVQVRYGGAEGGAEQRRFTFSGGVNKDKFQLAVVLDYFDLDSLLGAQRDLWRNQDFRRFNSFDRRSILSSPGNITSPNVIVEPDQPPVAANLPGLPSTFASVPLVDATPGLSRDDFLATAGELQQESLLKYSSLVPEATRLSASATASLDLTDRIAASAELLYVDRDSTYYFAPPSLAAMPVTATQAFNPFGATVLTYRLLPELGPQYQFVESDMVRTVATLHGGWGAWDWEMAAVYSDERASTWTHHVLATPAVLSALASTDPALALNPFQNSPVGSPELLASLLAPRVVSDFASTGTQLSGYIQGPIWSLPAGPLSTMAGVEWRNEGAVFNNPEAGSYDKNRDVTAGFAQLRLPLVSEAMRWPGVHELLLTTGTRIDQYSDGDRIDRTQVGLLWKPHRSFTVRASGGSSFRPPSLHDLYFPATTTIGRVTDSARGNELATIAIRVGGNTALSPTTARSRTIGFTFSPDTAVNWKVSADYWRVTMKERVISLSLPLLLANETVFANRIERDEPTDADLAAGLPGALRLLDSSRVNAGRVKTSGVDLSIKADVQTDFGRFTPELLATWFDEYRSSESPNGPELDRVGLASDLGSILQWRAIFSIGWKRGPFGANLFARYTPSYDDSFIGERNGRTIDSQTLIDLHGSLDLGKLLPAARWDGFKINVGGMNIFDQAPGFAEVGDTAGFDQSQADLKQRSYYLRLEKKF